MLAFTHENIYINYVTTAKQRKEYVEICRRAIII